jgi:hypothetical protein
MFESDLLPFATINSNPAPSDIFVQDIDRWEEDQRILRLRVKEIDEKDAKLRLEEQAQRQREGRDFDTNYSAQSFLQGMTRGATDSRDFKSVTDSTRFPLYPLASILLCDERTLRFQPRFIVGATKDGNHGFIIFSLRAGARHRFCTLRASLLFSRSQYLRPHLNFVVFYRCASKQPHAEPLRYSTAFLGRTIQATTAAAHIWLQYEFRHVLCDNHNVIQTLNFVAFDSFPQRYHKS